MFQRLAGPFKEFGLLAGSVYVIDRVFQTLTSNLRLIFYELVVQQIAEKPLIPASLLRTVEVREIKPGDPELELMPVTTDTLGFRFSQSAVCLGAFQDGQFIGYMWCCFGSYDEDEVRCTYTFASDGEAVFDFDLYLLPEHRLGLGFVGIWNGANKFLRERGIRHSFSRLTRFNLASRRAHTRLGAKRIGRAFFLRAWKVEIAVATVPPYVGFSLRESDRVRLQLRAVAATEDR